MGIARLNLGILGIEPQGGAEIRFRRSEIMLQEQRQPAIFVAQWLARLRCDNPPAGGFGFNEVEAQNAGDTGLQEIPACNAMRTSSDRLVAAILVITLARCTSTVRGLRSRS